MARRKQVLYWCVLALLLAGWLYIAWNVPYTHDDWDWGLPEGLERWLSGALNNRYAGTFFVLAMTRSQLVKTAVMGGCMFLISLLLGRLAGRGQPDRAFSVSVVTAALLFTTPMDSWQQSLGWVSAFANFVVAAVFLLLVLLLWQRSFSAPLSRVQGTKLGAALFFLCLAAQLFAEHLTLILLCAALVCAGWALWKKTARLPILCSLAGCLLGAVLMFHNPLYGELAASGQAVDGIRNLVAEPGQGLFTAALKRFFGEVLPWLFECFPGAAALASAGCLWRLIRRRTPWFLTIPAGLWMAYYCAQNWLYLNQLHLWGEWTYPWPLLRGPGAAIQLALMAAVLLTAREKSRPTWLLLLAAAVGLLAPFALLQDSGARCAFLSAVVLMVLGASLLSDLPWSPLLQGAALVGLAAGLVFHLHAYAAIGRSEAIRQDQMAQAVAQGADQVVLPTEGWAYCYCWQRNPSQMRADYFRQFYGLPADMELVFLPRGSSELWPEVPEAMWAGAVYLPPTES